MLNRVIEIVAEVMAAPPNAIDESTSSATLEAWDSLRHMNLIVAIEDGFDIVLDEDAFARLDSVRAIVEELHRARAAA